MSLLTLLPFPQGPKYCGQSITLGTQVLRPIDNARFYSPHINLTTQIPSTVLIIYNAFTTIVTTMSQLTLLLFPGTQVLRPIDNARFYSPHINLTTQIPSTVLIIYNAFTTIVTTMSLLTLLPFPQGLKYCGQSITLGFTLLT
ncbi:hypothetical protein J6590_078306 [Homalodisca vitripennis]|nr:hypothetical protein J6590_078306 [Homalodisca vitripennis]